MSRKRLYYLVGGGVVVAAIVLSLVFGVFQKGYTEPKGADLLASAVSPSNDITQQGIKVHGSWALEISNADGTVVTRREFENALTSYGAGELTHILLGDRTPGNIAIMLYIDRGGGSTSYFYIAESTETADAIQSNNLTLSIPTTGPDAGKLVMSGSVTVSVDGTIPTVATWFKTGPPNVAPASATNFPGGGATNFELTNANLPSPAPSVVAGQQVAAKVVLRFQ